jgi:hypothetical protein
MHQQGHAPPPPFPRRCCALRCVRHPHPQGTHRSDGSTSPSSLRLPLSSRPFTNLFSMRTTTCAMGGGRHTHKEGQPPHPGKRPRQCPRLPRTPAPTHTRTWCPRLPRTHTHSHTRTWFSGKHRSIAVNTLTSLRDISSVPAGADTPPSSGRLITTTDAWKPDGGPSPWQAKGGLIRKVGPHKRAPNPNPNTNTPTPTPNTPTPDPTAAPLHARPAAERQQDGLAHTCYPTGGYNGSIRLRVVVKRNLQVKAGWGGEL